MDKIPQLKTMRYKEAACDSMPQKVKDFIINNKLTTQIQPPVFQVGNKKGQYALTRWGKNLEKVRLDYVSGEHGLLDRYTFF